MALSAKDIELRRRVQRELLGAPEADDMELAYEPLPTEAPPSAYSAEIAAAGVPNAADNQQMLTPDQQFLSPTRPSQAPSIPSGATVTQTPNGVSVTSPTNQAVESQYPGFDFGITGLPKGQTLDKVLSAIEQIPAYKTQKELVEQQRGLLAQEMNRPSQLDLSGLAKLTDAWTGSQFAKGIKPEDRTKLRSLLQQQLRLSQGALTDEQRKYLQTIIGGVRPAGSGSKDPEQALRKEFNALKVIKNTSEVQQSYNKIRNAAGDVSAAGDLSMVFAFMKMLDPDSVVRESEQATAQNARGVPEKIRNSWNQLLRGERLSPGQRQDFLNQADNLLQAQITAQKDAEKMYTEIARSKGINPDKVIIKYKEEKKTGKIKTPEGKVEVINPDGKRVRISSAQLDSALRQGYRKL